MAVLSRQPWRELPPEAAGVLAPGLPALAEEIIEAISEGVPEYALPLEGAFGRGLRRGVEEALGRFLDLFGTEGDEADPRREIYVELGRGELRAGRPLEALLAAYRLGARVAWRRQAAAGEEAGLDPQTLYLLAESIFAYIDEISAESVEGYALAQAAVAGEAQRRRRALARLLIQDPPADPDAVRAASEAAGWSLPEQLAAVVTDTEDADALALRLGQGTIAVSDPAGACALVPDPGAPGRRASIERSLSGRKAGLGPAGPWVTAPLSVQRARAALSLDGDGLIVADDRRLDLLLASDPRLTRDLAAAWLAPLDGETEASRARLTETLAAWLDHQGRTERVAAALDVHPQTVRYRLTRLRDLFGADLDDPGARRELAIAVAARSAADRAG